MKLQVNNTGAWKTVAVVWLDGVDDAMHAALALADLAAKAGSKCTWRLLDGCDAWVAYCVAGTGWVDRKPRADWVG